MCSHEYLVFPGKESKSLRQILADSTKLDADKPEESENTQMTFPYDKIGN